MKTINMKKQLSFAFSLSALAFFAACGDNVTDNAPVATQAYDGQEDFPDCDKDYEGMFATVKSKQELYICTAEKWVNLTTGATVSDKEGSGNTGCTSKELADKSGVTVFCNGDSVAVLKYGKDGSKGATGSSGDTGGKGSDGKNGGNGSNGSDAKMDPSRCLPKYTGLDVTVYDCADSVYVKKQSKKLSSTVWIPVDPSTASYSSAPNTGFNAYEISTVYNDLDGATGDLEGGIIGEVTTDILEDNDYAITGTAKVNVTKEQTVSADKYRPFVGVKFTYSTAGIDISAKGGVCLTYSSEKDMNLLLEGETGFISATLPATKDGDEVKDTVVDLLWSAFTPVTEKVDWEKVLLKAKFAYVEAAGGEAVGEYANNFSVLQFGDYGNCNSTTYKSWIRHLNSVIGAEGTITDSDGEKYKTIIIGEQQWLAENLRKDVSETSTPTPCYVGTDDENCSKYGRKYTWEEALGADATTYGCTNSALCTSTLPEGVRGICPEGWHLPSYSDWQTLFNVVRDEPFSSSGYAFKDTKALAVYNSFHTYAKDLSKMNLYWNGTNEYIFAFTEVSGNNTQVRAINFYSYRAYLGTYNASKGTPRFLRCLRAAPTAAP